jgi:hypothetical protein
MFKYKPHFLVSALNGSAVLSPSSDGERLSDILQSQITRCQTKLILPIVWQLEQKIISHFEENYKLMEKDVGGACTIKIFTAVRNSVLE